MPNFAQAELYQLPGNPEPPSSRPWLKLAAIDGVILEMPTLPEDELAKRRDQLKGKVGGVAIEALQARYDAVTEFAEGIDGQMRAEIDITIDDNDLYGPDGRSLIETADNGLEAARREAADNPNLEFEVDRRILERKELDIVIDAFKTGKANTISVNSNYPSALRNGRRSVKYYNDRRQQAINRTWMMNPDTGKIKMVSQTLDRSDQTALEAIRTDLGFKTEGGEMLAQPMPMNLTSEQQDGLINRITSDYDQEMTRQYGGEWYAGRRPIDYRNTFEFASRQIDLVDVYVEAKLNNQLTNTLMYDLLATANARFEKDQFKRDKQSVTSVLSKAGIETSYNTTRYSRDTVMWEIQNQGRRARSSGKTFHACGSTYSSTGEESSEYSIESTGLGSSSGESKSWHGGSKHYNTKCESCKEVKKEVGACKICEDCVNNPKKQSHSGTKTTKKKVSYLKPNPSNYVKKVKLSGNTGDIKASKSYKIK